jgi:hypothetical protein
LTANNDARKFSDYNACNAPEANLFWVVTGNTAGVNTSYRVTTSTLFSNTPVDFIVSNTNVLSTNNFIVRNKATPVSSSDTVTAGKIWWDANYIYVAVANNTIKRAALSSF